MDSPILGGQGNRELLVHADEPAAMSAVAFVAHHERDQAAVVCRDAIDVARRREATRRGSFPTMPPCSGSTTSSASVRSPTPTSS